MRCIYALLLLCISACSFAQSVRVPQGKPIMLDGKLSAGEWTDAKSFDLGDRARVYAKQNNGDVLLAVEYLKGDNFTLDLYLAPADGKLYDLHSSAKLGERTLTDGNWSEQWTWWNNDRWVANFSRVDSWQERTFVGEKVREFQISRERFGGKVWKAYFELMAPASKNWETYRYPAEGSNKNVKNWFELALD